jgi:uncharacterized membrane protein YfcA
VASFLPWLAPASTSVDICSFATLTLLFRISEKVATPTSVCLMAINTCIGFGLRQFHMGGVAPESWEFLAVCVPVVVFGAPFGSVLGSYCHRLVLAAFVYVTDTVQIIAAYVIVNNSGKLDTELLVTGILCIVFGAVFFTSFSHVGMYLLDKVDVDHNVDSHEVDSKTENDKQLMRVVVG